MKSIKKIISSILAISMVAASAVSVSAFSYFQDTDSGMVFVEEAITMSEVKARQPKYEVKVEKLDNATFSSVDAVFNTLWASKKDANGEYLYDMYRVTYTFSNIGDLALGYSTSDSTITGVGLLGIKSVTNFDSKTDVKAQKAKDKSISSFKNNFGFSDNALAYDIYTTETNDPYPTVGAESLGGLDETGTVTMSSLFAVTAGKTVNFTMGTVGVEYAVVEGGVGNVASVTPTLVGENSFKLGVEAPVDKPVEFSAALAEKTDFGYIWALTFTQSADKLASFTAKFEADGVEPAERTVANASDIATALKGKTAPIVLNVGLSTTKTLTKATFTADDAVETTEACVFVAPLSK